MPGVRCRVPLIDRPEVLHYDGPGVLLYDGPGIPLYDGPGISLYDGPGISLYDGPGVPSPGPGSGASMPHEQCPTIQCQIDSRSTSWYDCHNASVPDGWSRKLLLRDFARYLKTSPNASSFRVVITGDVGEDNALPTIEQAAVADAEVVEGMGLISHAVGSPDGTCFTHFLDGIQIARRVGFYADSVPVLYGYIAAAIRKRDYSKRMSTYAQESRDNLYCSSRHLISSGIIGPSFELRDTPIKDKNKGDDTEVHPLRLLEIARQTVSNDRTELERDLASRWVGASRSDEWLLWDGSITGRAETSKHPRIVGIIKSHQTQYFRLEEQKKILRLKPGERSSVFQPRGRDWSPVYSWYLRLHPNEGRDIYFGLVRVEAAARGETLEMADEISRWILAERSPLSLPDSRWDRMIYPIRDCEQYLRSLAPTKVMIEAALAGVPYSGGRGETDE